MYLVPPMDDEPPDDFVAFVYVQLACLQREAARLTGGPQYADQVYPEALADVAGHWRRLRLRRRLTRRDAPVEFLTQRLTTRAARWRAEQIYDVQVEWLRPQVQPRRPAASIALRKAALLPSTERRQIRPLAEATIAWTHAWRRAYWRRYIRITVTVAVIFLGLFQTTSTLPN